MVGTIEKVTDLPTLLALREQWRKGGAKVVFTNGCFDILHVGHIDYLEKAKALGDKLVVGLNADASVKRLKGEQRPVNHELARAKMLAALAFTDAIVLFGEDTPLQIIQSLLPDVLVKGSDYQIDQIVGAQEVQAAGGTVERIPLVEGYSTTAIIKKIVAKPG